MGKTLRLTTRGRKSGQPRAVTIWYLVETPGTYLVQHQSPKPAQWYANLRANPAVQVDLGDGRREATAEVITDAAEIDALLAKLRKKYWAAWIFYLLGWRRNAVAARIRVAGR